MRRARLEDAREAGLLWLQLLMEQAARDRTRIPDADALGRWLNDFPYWVRDEYARILVAEEEGRLAGFLKAHVRSVAPVFVPRREAYLEAIYVEEEARRRGTGRQLLRALAKWAADMGPLAIRLHVATHNDAGRAFWTSLGAEPAALELCIEPVRILAACKDV